MFFLRWILLAMAGVVSGYLSWKSIIWLGGIGSAFESEMLAPLRWTPGAWYAVLWMVVVLIGGGFSVRRHSKRVLLWGIAFLAGIVLSYVAAYETAFHYIELFADQVPIQSERAHYVIAGLAGGIPGSLGLACVLSIYFRAADSWRAKIFLTLCGTGLGSALALWPIYGDRPDGDASGLLYFFVIWQGGMALAIGAIDWAHRRRHVES